MANNIAVQFLLCRKCGLRVQAACFGVDVEGAEMLKVLAKKARARVNAELLRLTPVEEMHNA